jgi:hypothetical protein
MPSHETPTLPTPLAALVGLVPAVGDRLRALPAKAVTVPVILLGTALTKAESARAEYDALAVRGSALVARLRGTASEAVSEFADEVSARADDLEDRVERLAGRALPDDAPVARTPAATPPAAQTPAPKTPAAKTPADTAVRTAAATDDTPAAERPKAVPTPKAPSTAHKKVTTAASPANALAAELVAEATAMSVPAHDELPLEDYDGMTLGSLRSRLRTLSSEQLVQLRAYEKEHAARLPVLTMLDNRIAKLAADGS